MDKDASGEVEVWVEAPDHPPYADSYEYEPAGQHCACHGRMKRPGAKHGPFICSQPTQNGDSGKGKT